MRRGIDAVRHEQLTKALAYNIRRMVWVREKNERAAREIRNRTFSIGAGTLS
ncbi:MAG: hypothetical protein ACI8T1_000831 [Verrucomicrobiales bacterium]|jgi:hypothetical protein